MKPIQSSSPFRPPGRFWSNHGVNVSLLVVLAFCRSLTVIMIALTIDAMVRFGVSQDSVLKLASLGFILIVTRILERKISERMGTQYVNQIRHSLVKRLMRVSDSDIKQKKPGVIAARLGTDLASVKRWISLGLARLISNSLMLISLVFTITVFHPPSGIVVSAVLLGLMMLTFSLGLLLNHSIVRVRRARVKIFARLVERVSEILVIRSCGQESRELNRLRRTGRRLEQYAERFGMIIGLIRGISESAPVFLVLGLLLSYSLTQGAIDPMTLIVMMSLILFVSSPVRELSRTYEYFHGARLSLRQLKALSDMPRISRGRSKWVNTLKKPGHVHLQRIEHFGLYDGFSASVQSGERVFISGSNGSGKSTLVKIISGMIKPESGKVRTNGINPCRLSPNARASCLGIAGIDYGHVTTNVHELINYRRQIRDALSAQISESDILHELLKGVIDADQETASTEQRQWSSGERARLGLARAVLGNPEILILDEADANLDNNALRVFDALVASYPGTVLLISHRADFEDICDWKWDLDKSSVVRLDNRREIKLHRVS